MGARSKDLLILEKEMAACADEQMVMTDDGSYGKKGVITVGIEEVLKREPVNLVVTIGPAIMMKFVALLTKKYQIHYHCQFEYHHGRWNRNVRRLPGFCGR